MIGEDNKLVPLG